jgi:hypothetical protein
LTTPPFPPAAAARPRLDLLLRLLHLRPRLGVAALALMELRYRLDAPLGSAEHRGVEVIRSQSRYDGRREAS